MPTTLKSRIDCTRPFPTPPPPEGGRVPLKFRCRPSYPRQSECRHVPRYLLPPSDPLHVPPHIIAYELLRLKAPDMVDLKGVAPKGLFLPHSHRQTHGDTGLFLTHSQRLFLTNSRVPALPAHPLSEWTRLLSLLLVPIQRTAWELRGGKTRGITSACGCIVGAGKESRGVKRRSQHLPAQNSTPSSTCPRTATCSTYVHSWELICNSK